MVENRPGVRTLAEVALAEMREAILSGELAPGSQIRLQDQAKRLQMSSVPIREALRFLERSGLVDRTPHRGSYVAGMSERDLEEIYTIRLELESMAVRLACKRITEDDRVRLHNLLDRYVGAARENSPAVWDRHAEIHMALYDLSGSKWLLLLLPMLWDGTERYRRASLHRQDVTEDWIAEHRRIVESCAAQDEEGAVDALQSHLRHAFETVVAELRNQERISGSARPDLEHSLP